MVLSPNTPNLCMLLSSDDTSFTTVKWQSSKFAAPNIFSGFGELLLMLLLPGNGTFPFPFLYYFIYFFGIFHIPKNSFGSTT